MVPVSPAILACIARGQTILTANQRAARTLRVAYNRNQQSSGASLWDAPEIFAIDTWLSAQHHRLTLAGHETRLLLNPTQQHTVWRDIIAADPAVSGLRSLDSLADMAAEAWHLLHIYLGVSRLRECNVSTDTRAFQRWAEAFVRAAARGHYLTAAELPAAISLALADGSLDLPSAGLALVDFDTLQPAHAELFENIRRAGYNVDRITTAVPSAGSLLTAPDDASELRAAALWAKDHLPTPSAPSQTASLFEVKSIAIVVPNLSDRRSQIERAFSGLLPSDSFEFSLGQPLAEAAPAAIALDLLRWTLEPLPLDAISNLLLSPFFGSPTPEKAVAAAEFDAFELRQAFLLRPELSLEATLNLARRTKRAPHLTPLLESLGATRFALETWDVQPHTAWADHFRELLEAANWTAATNRDSLAFQTRRRFDSALDELATLDFRGETTDASTALQALTRICRNAIFAPESRHAPIQIIGPLEPGGTTFDALWFLSADDQSWPQPAASSPFLPWHLQRDLGIPAAAPERAAALAQTLTTRIAHTAPQSVFSYAEHSSDGHRRRSPLLRDLSLEPRRYAAAAPRDPLPLVLFADTESVPPLPPGVTPGGARILELQAQCSFRAFAEIRLHSTQPDSQDLGLDASQRGIQVHKIMQLFWDQVQSQKSLRNLTIAQRDEILDEAIEAAIARAASAAQTPWEDAYLDVQRRRLRALLHPWLDFELTRPAFSVRQQEEKRIAQIGPLSIDFRIDRIDETQGGPLILDYKTGVASPSQWKSDRPDAPQLPLYAVLSPEAESLGGVAFALLRAGDDLDLKGYARTAVIDSPTTNKDFPTLQDQLEDWHRVLTALAEAFASSDPITNPKAYPRTCQYCAQRILCRLDPTPLTIDEDEIEVFDD